MNGENDTYWNLRTWLGRDDFSFIDAFIQHPALDLISKLFEVNPGGDESLELRLKRAPGLPEVVVLLTPMKTNEGEGYVSATATSDGEGYLEAIRVWEILEVGVNQIVFVEESGAGFMVNGESRIGLVEVSGGDGPSWRQGREGGLSTNLVDFQDW